MIIRDLFFFFFSSRRRHTRLQGDWSSDVCSSDLLGRFELPSQGPKPRRIDQATPQPRRREVPDGAINTLSQARGFGVPTEAHASFAAARIAASLVFRGLHPFDLMRSIASCITRTSPAQPRPPPAPPVHRYSTSVRPSSSQMASAKERTVIVSSLPRL